MNDLSPTVLLAEHAYRQIKKLVLSGEMGADTVIREAELARQIGVSRTPVREALNRLHAEKLLELSPSGGYLVVQFTAEDLEEIYALRAALEGLAANLAARKMNRIAAAVLQDQLDAMEAAVKSRDDAKLVELNSKFHSAIAGTSGNKLLQTMLVSIQDIFERYRMPAIADESRRFASYMEHREIVEALIERDSDLAEQRIKRHVQKALEMRRRAQAQEKAKDAKPRRASAKR